MTAWHALVATIEALRLRLHLTTIPALDAQIEISRTVAGAVELAAVTRCHLRPMTLLVLAEQPSQVLLLWL